MKKAASNKLKKLGNENSYTKEFFEDLCKKISLENSSAKADLGRSIILAAQAYMRSFSDYKRQLPPYEVQKELKKATSHIDKAAESLIKVYASGNYGSEIVNNLYDVIQKKYPSLQGTLKEIRRGDEKSVLVTSPLKSVDFLASIADAVEQTLKTFNPKKTTARSVALCRWIMILSAQLEPIIGHKLEQSHYYKDGNKGEYISKKEISDSELLLLIIKPLDPNVTISQIETAIKETRKERHDAPWDNYFPKG